jgi:hypothetical protein
MNAIDFTAIGKPANAVEVLLTPELAKRFKEYQAPNRNVSHNQVARMCADIESGNWVFNGETIKFRASDGMMFDGGHRVEAVIKTGKALPVIVVWGVEEDFVDYNRPRSTGDELVIKWAVANGPDVAAATSLILRYEATPKGAKFANNAGPYLRKSLIEHRGGTDVSIANSCYAVGHGNFWTGWMPRRFMAFAAYFVAKTDPDVVIPFIEECRSGENLVKGDPAYALRTGLMQKHTSMRFATHREDWVAAVTAKAWINRASGGRMGRLQYNVDEPFPRFRCDVTPPPPA